MTKHIKLIRFDWSIVWWHAKVVPTIIQAYVLNGL